MTSREDRAVSTLIGFILLFGILIVSWSVYQAVAIPGQNQQVEFNHNQKAQSEVLNVRDAALRTGTTGVQQSTTVQVGVDYPRRTFAINPSISGGRIRLRDTAPANGNRLIIRNARATDKETRDYFDSDVTITTKSIEYHPEYSHYQNAPDTVITGGSAAAINEFRDTNLSIGDQVLIDDRTITIVSFNGSLNEGRGGEASSVTLETKPLSVSERSITVRNNSKPINLTIPTQIDNTAVWNQSSLTDERTTGAVINVTRLQSNYIRVFLKKGTYTLRMMQVGFGSGTEKPGVEYITDVDTPNTVIEETSAKLTYEVRDKFNNPENGVLVNASVQSPVPSGDEGPGPSEQFRVVGEDNSLTDPSASDWLSGNTSDGKLVLNYTAPNVTTDTDVTINVTILSNSSAKQRVSTTFTVPDTDAGGGGTTSGDGSSDEVNPGASGQVILDTVSASAGGQEELDATLKNTGSSQKTITAIRVNFYYSKNKKITAVDGISNQSTSKSLLNNPSVTNSEGTIPTPFFDANQSQATIKAGGSLTIRFNWDGQVADGSGGSDFFFFSVKFSNGDVATYIANP